MKIHLKNVDTFIKTAISYKKDSLKIEIIEEDTNDKDLTLWYLPIDHLKKNENLFNVITQNGYILNNKVKSILFIGSIPFNFNVFKRYLGLDKDDKVIEDYRYFLADTIDGRYRFLDSSIWFRYLCIEEFLEQLKTDKPKVLTDIIKFKDLYDLPVAQEFRDFQIRLFKESHIEPVGEQGANHGGEVTPFAFHLEGAMTDRINEIESVLEGLKWNILFIDDYANKCLKDNKENEGWTKGSVINHIFDGELKAQIKGEGKEEVKYFKSTYYEMYFETTIKGGLKAIKKQKEASRKNRFIHYDILLLDYLFIEDNTRKFGEDLLAELLSDNPDENAHEYLGEDILRGWSGKFWIMPISVYQNALTDKLRDLGIPLYDEKWVFSQGADPICTPQLFKYKLMSMMKRQLEEVAVIEYNEITEKYMVTSKLSHLLKKMVEPQSGQSLTFEYLIKNATKYFPKFVELGVIVKRLFIYKKNSLFAETALEKFFKGINLSDWAEMERLIYLLSHGGAHNKDLIWKINERLKKNLKSEEDQLRAIQKGILK